MSYTKNTWVTGDIVTAAKLNNIENGVYNNDQNISSEAIARAAAEGKLQGSMAAAYSTSATYAVGDYCIKDGQLYKCTTAITTAEAWTAAHWSAVALGDDTRDLRSALTSETEAREAADEALEESVAEILEGYAEKDGTYEDLTSGNTKQLLSDVYTENSEPYLFRKTGGSDKVGSREYLDKIVGGSLVVNQLIPDNNKSYSNSLTDTRTFVNLYFRENSSPFTTIINSFVYEPRTLVRIAASTFSGRAAVFHNGASTNLYLVNNINVISGHKYLFNLKITGVDVQTVGGFTTDDLMLIDLTAEFGTTIADYVYNLETATAGSGIAWLKQYIDLDTYRPYSAPTLKHVEGLQSHDTVGFNLFDEELEAAQWRNIASGTVAYKTESSSAVCCKNPIPVLPNSTYFFWCSKYPTLGTAYADVVLLDKDKKYIGYNPPGGYLGRDTKFVVTTAETRYIVFNMFRSYGMTYDHDICINLSDSQKNGTYEPYQKRSYPLDPSVVLRGYPMLVDGKLKFDGDEYLYNGTINRNYNIVDMGTLNWDVQHDDTDYQDYVSSDLMNIIQTVNEYTLPHIVCQNFVPIERNTQSSQASQKTNTIGVTSTGRLRIVVAPSSYPNVAAFKASLSGTYLVYKKATPTTETAEPFHQLQICDTYGTESFVTTSEVPVGTETRYPEDLKSKIEGLPWDLSMIAPIEDGTTASKAYTTGQYFLHNNVFCKALTSIASGATFTLNTNYSETTVAAELYTALH